MLPPSKLAVLKHLDEGGPQPIRRAYAVLFLMNSTNPRILQVLMLEGTGWTHACVCAWWYNPATYCHPCVPATVGTYQQSIELHIHRTDCYYQQYLRMQGTCKLRAPSSASTQPTTYTPLPPPYTPTPSNLQPHQTHVMLPLLPLQSAASRLRWAPCPHPTHGRSWCTPSS
jgi:hypothetical protein